MPSTVKLALMGRSPGVDATYVKVRQDGRIVSVAVIVAVGVNGNGRRGGLGMAIGPSEAETFWTDFLCKLARSGLRGVKLVVSDAHEGLKAAVTRVLNASWQRCPVHLMCNVLAEIEDDCETYGALNYVFWDFGDPAGKEPWGWRVDGHYLSLNFAQARGEIAVTATFYDANPATVEHGPRAGLRVLGNEEDLGRRLIRGLPITTAPRP